MKRRGKQRQGAGYVRPRPQGNGTTRYQARWPEDGRTRGKTFDTEDEAWAFVRSQQRGRTAPAEMTVDGLVGEMLDRAGSRLSERTVLTYRTRARKMIAPYLGTTRIIDLTTLDVQRWIDQLGRDGYQSATIHAAVAVLHSILRDAAILGIIERNIAEGIRRPSIEPIRRTEWTAAQARRFLIVVKDDELYGALYAVALATGMRPGELRALPWTDVDLETGTIIVNRTMTKDVHGHEVIGRRTKTRRGRAVAISAPVIASLRRHRRVQQERQRRVGDWHDEGLVFDRGDGHWIGQATWRRAHQAFCDRAGVPFCRAHDLRHISASLELEAGTHPKIVADRLGHANIAMTVDRYSHVSAELQRTAADALSVRLFADATTSRAKTAKRHVRTRIRTRNTRKKARNP